jgi:hypothetical protein
MVLHHLIQEAGAGYLNLKAVCKVLQPTDHKISFAGNDRSKGGTNGHQPHELQAILKHAHVTFMRVHRRNNQLHMRLTQSLGDTWV